MRSKDLVVFTRSLPEYVIRLKHKIHPRKDGLILLSMKGSSDVLYYDSNKSQYLLRMRTGKEVKFKDDLTPDEIISRYSRFRFQYYEKFDHLEYLFDPQDYGKVKITVYENYSFALSGRLQVYKDEVIDKPHARVKITPKFVTVVEGTLDNLYATFVNFIEVSLKGSVGSGSSRDVYLVESHVKDVLNIPEVVKCLKDMRDSIPFWSTRLLKNPDLDIPLFEPINKTLSVLFKIILEYIKDNKIFIPYLMRSILRETGVQIIFNQGKLLITDQSGEVLHSFSVNVNDNSTILAALNDDDVHLLLKYLYSSMNIDRFLKIYKAYAKTFNKIEEV